MSEILRVALLGGGKMAQQHAAAIRQCRDARLVAVVDPHVAADELASRFGSDVAGFSDVTMMLAEVLPDVVHIVTPPATHVPLARQCLEAGVHVYVEKPFALAAADAESILRLADMKGLKACAAHQVLFQEAGTRYKRHLPMIGKIVHVESFFSFKPVRRRTAGGPSTLVDQLIDILPHPVYLLLDALPSENEDRAELTALDVSIDGEVRAVVRRGAAMATLIVSLNARPVESWLRLMGRNGMVEADFVLGNVIKHPGPGASAPAVVLKPFSRAWQLGWGSFKAVLKLVVRQHKSYPGLAELLALFYSSIRDGAKAPVSAAAILDTVTICEAISERLHADESAAEERAVADLGALESRLPTLNGRGVVLLTGGTGMLGEPTARLLRSNGWRVRVPVRRRLSPRQQLPGIEYVQLDLANDIPDSLMGDVKTVIHLAAETAGTRLDHERNTILATRNLLEAMVRAGVRRLVNISSVAVLKPSRFGRALTETSPVDSGNLARGPYVWAKAQAEESAQQFASEGKIDVRTIRLGPLTDYDAFTSPGRLGREITRLFIAMGRPSNRLSICSVQTAASVLARYVAEFDTLPSCVNLVEVPAPRRGELAQRLRHSRPDLVVLWMPFWILRILSTGLKAAQKLIHPRSPALDLYSAFKSELYDGHIARQLTSSAAASRDFT